MGRCLHRFLINLWLGSVLLVFAASAGFNGYLVLNKKQLLSKINKAAAPCQVFFRDIYFLPPHFFFLKDALISDVGQALAAVPLVRLDLPLPRLLRKEISFSGVRIYEAEVNALSLARFIRVNYPRFLALLSRFKASCGRFSAIRVKVREAPKSGPSDIDLSFREGFFKGKGSLALPLSVFPFQEMPAVKAVAARPIDWSIAGSFNASRLSLDKCELKGEYFSAQLSGEFENEEILCRGFFLANSAQAGKRLEVIALEQKNGLAALRARMELFLLRLFKREGETEERLQWEELYAGDGLDLLEFDCRLALRLPRIEIKRVQLGINRLPLIARGSLFVGTPLSFELDISSSLLPRETSLPYSLHGWVNGIADNGIRLSGEMDFNFRPSPEPSAWKEARLRFTDLKYSLRRGSRFSLCAGQFLLLIMQNGENRYLRLDNPRLLLFLADPRYKYLILNAQTAGGGARGQCRIDTAGAPVKAKAFVSLKGARAERLKGLSAYFSRLSGALDGSFRYVFPPGLCTGSLRVSQGTLREFEFFTWLEEFFLIPGLNRVDFEELAADFWIGKEGAGFTGLSLCSSKTGISGDYGMKDGRVNGRLTFSLARRLLEDSRKFRPLLKLVDRKRQSLNFSFRLSGRPEAMNFLWVQSEFKRELQEAIPNFIERRIQRNVERMISDLTPSR